MTYLSRYQKGEYERVWKELLALGARVRQDAVYPDALAVARETMRRARANIDLLIPRLREIGYLFEAENPDKPIYPDAVFMPPSDSGRAFIEQIEKSAGVFPISLRAWYDVVGSVNLMGKHPGIRFFEDEPLADPLVVDPISDYHLDLLADWEADRDEVGEDESYRLEIAPDEYHKAKITGEAPYSIALPNASADARLLDEWHNTTFVNYLRSTFRFGGFPGFERLPDGERPDDLIAFLTKDFLPL
ncbi:MAG: hypothetical protein HZB51_27150 [Chloroflexi bacterium]|nr:hypothetical protein [Chloroflexota bacterium]